MPNTIPKKLKGIWLRLTKDTDNIAIEAGKQFRASWIACVGILRYLSGEGWSTREPVSCSSTGNDSTHTRAGGNRWTRSPLAECGRVGRNVEFSSRSLASAERKQGSPESLPRKIFDESHARHGAVIHTRTHKCSASPIVTLKLSHGSWELRRAWWEFDHQPRSSAW